ncbi:MAG: hypothetical protein LC667_16650 [Thioalkalivibrio sp.]|nr:hypothetical protein [Thioalkalivibrio sp.]
MSSFRRRTSSSLVISLTTIVLLGQVGPASAVDTCPGGINIGADGSYTMTQNFVASSGYTCLSISGANATFDLNGFDIQQANGGGTALVCNDVGIRITDSAGGGQIHGHWVTGISNCSVIDNVTVGDVGYAVSNSAIGLRSVRNSVLEGDVITIVGTLESSASKILDNDLTGGNRVVSIEGMSNSSMDGKARISGNVMHGGRYEQIWTDDDVNVHVEDNLLTDYVGGSDCTDFGTGTTSRRLYCDCAECSGANPAFDFPSEGTFSACPGQLSTGDFTSSKYALTSDLDLAATSGFCIKVVDANTTIDLNGHTIYNSQSGGTAIVFETGGGNTVTDTGSVRGGITGDFDYAIQDAIAYPAAVRRR